MKTKRTKAQAVRLSLAALALAMAPWTSSALAVTATVTTSVRLRAGPSTHYPSITMLFSGSTVQVFGCEQGNNWCDVQIGANRVFLTACRLHHHGRRR
jgi:uncharacterized protein YraI